MCWIMLNPSTADAALDDPTIRRCIGFSQRWGFGGLVVVNLFALRATDPKELLKHRSPIGDRNDAFIKMAIEGCALTVCAWGTAGNFMQRDEQVKNLLNGHKPVHLGLTKNGHPKHPLYLSSTTLAQDWFR